MGSMRAVVEFVRPVLLVAWKDVLLEIRNREVVATALVFGVMMVVIFNFALNITPETVNVLAPGVLWVAFSFAGVLAMGRAFVAEKEEGCLDALLLCPVSRDSLYFGKMLAMFLFMIVIEAALLPHLRRFLRLLRLLGDASGNDSSGNPGVRSSGDTVRRRGRQRPVA